MSNVAVLGVTTTLLPAPALADGGTGRSVLHANAYVHVSQTNFHNLHGSSAFVVLARAGLETEMYRNPRSNQEPSDAAVDLLSGYLRGQLVS